jgi:hypothetical protein
MSKPEWWRRFWVEAAIFAVVFSVSNIAFYFSSIIDLYGLAQGTFGIFFIILVTCTLRYIILDILSDKTRLRIMKIGYTGAGASFGTIFAGILSVFIIWAFNIHGPISTFEIWFRMFLVFGVAPIVGALVGYKLGERRGFRRLSI